MPVQFVRSLTILGGGPAGLGLAFYAHQAGVPFVLVEASSKLGGMSAPSTGALP